MSCLFIREYMRIITIITTAITERIACKIRLSKYLAITYIPFHPPAVRFSTIPTDSSGQFLEIQKYMARG